MTGLSISANWKGDNYDSILVVVDRLTKMVYYKLVKITINALGLAKLIIDAVIQYLGLPDSIISDRRAIITSKFWLCYFFGIKRWLFTAFYPQTNGQTEWQNSIMEVYLWVFVNFEQNDWARLLPMAEFAYNNAKNTNTSHTPFELNCNYHPWMLYKEEVNPRSQSKSADELSKELKELMIVYCKNLYHA